MERENSSLRGLSAARTSFQTVTDFAVTATPCGPLPRTSAGLREQTAPTARKAASLLDADRDTKAESIGHDPSPCP